MSSSLLETLFPPLEFSTPFWARGCLFGRFIPHPPPDDNRKLHFIKGTLQINEVVQLPVVFETKLWLKLSTNSTFSPDNAYLWRVFFRTTPDGQLNNVELIRNIPLEGHLSLDNPPPPGTGVDQFYIRGEVRYSDEQKVVLRLRRNEKAPPGYEQARQWRPFLLTVSSGLPQASIREFWDLSCIRKGDSLVLTEAHLVEKASLIKKPALTIVKSKSKSKSKSSTPSNTNISPNQVIMIEGKQAEITVKFNTRPDLPEVGKVVTLEITTLQGVSVRANVNRKTLKKQVEKMDNFTDWIAALSGKVARIDPNGVIEIEGASVAVFEKKPKDEAVSEVEIKEKPASYVETEVQKSMV